MSNVHGGNDMIKTVNSIIKKFVSSALSFVMVLSCFSGLVFAEEADVVSGEENIPLNQEFSSLALTEQQSLSSDEPEVYRVIYEDDFEDVEGLLPQNVYTKKEDATNFLDAESFIGYHGWTLGGPDAAIQNSLDIFQIDADPEPEKSGNKVLKFQRQPSQIGTNDNLHTNTHMKKTFENPIDNAVVKISFDMYYTKNSIANEAFNFSLAPFLDKFRSEYYTVRGGKTYNYNADEKQIMFNQPNKWHKFELYLNYDINRVSVYVDDTQIGPIHSVTTIEPFYRLLMFQERGQHASKNIFRIDNLRIVHQAAPLYVSFAEISNGQDKDNITGNLNLIEKNDKYAFEWSSSDSECITNEGVVNVPDFIDKNVTITAKVKDLITESEIDTQKFDLTVPFKGDILWTEDFEDAEPDTDLVVDVNTGYKAWRVIPNLTVNGAPSTLERAAAEGTFLRIKTDPLNPTNKALNVARKLNYSYHTSPVDGKEITDWVGRLKFPAENDFTRDMVYFGGRINISMSNGRIRMGSFFGTLFDDHWEPSSFFNSGADVNFTAEEKALFKLKKWNTFGVVMNFFDHKAQLYINQVPVGPEVFMSLSVIDMLEINIPRAGWGGDNYLDDLHFKRHIKENEEWISLALDKIDIEYNEEGITESVVLPATSLYGTTLEWTSSDKNTIATDGAIKRPVGVDAHVVLTANVTREGVTQTKEFPIIVKGYSEAEYVSNNLKFSEIGNNQRSWYITDNLSLMNEYDGVSVSWESGNTEVLSHRGVVTRKDTDVPVTLKGTFTTSADTFTKEYNLVIAGRGKVLHIEDFSTPTTEGQSIDGWNGWSIAEPYKLPSINATIRKNINDTLKSYEEAEKVLSISRYMTAAEGVVCNQKVQLSFPQVKAEIMRIDFDCLFKDEKTTLYVELEGMNRHYGISQTGMGLKVLPEHPYGKTLSTNKWHHISIEINRYTSEYTLYLDYKKLNDEPVYEPGACYINGINFYSNHKTAGVHETFMINNIMVRDITLAPQEAVERAEAALETGDIDYETGRINLPLYGIENTAISWTSSDPEIITDDGKVTKPRTQKDVVLTAKVEKGEAYVTKDITVTVLPSNGRETPTVEILEIIASQLKEEDITDERRFRLTKNLNLPTEIITGRAADIGGVDITWDSNYPAIINNKGEIFKQPYEAAATLTATISSKTNPEIKATKELKFAVDAGAEMLAEYLFDDMDESNAGAEISSWSTMQLRAREADTEYGTQVFADKAPTDRYLPYDKANKAMFLNRYTNAGHDMVTAMSHTMLLHPKTGENYHGDYLVLDFRVQFRNSSDTIKGQIYCIDGTYITITPSAINVDGFVNKKFAVPLEPLVWHDIAFYYDIKSYRLDIYVNGEKFTDEPIEYGAGSQPFFHQWRLFCDHINYIVVDEMRIRRFSLPDAESVVSDAMEKTEIPLTITEDIKLPSYVGNCSVSWKSSDETIITAGGNINPSSSSAKTATLTASFRYGSIIKTKSFNVSLPVQTPYKKAYEIKNIAVSDNRVTGFEIVKMNETDTSSKLMVALYDKNEFKNLYLYDFGETALNAPYSVNTDISLEGMSNYKIMAFVVDGDNNNKVISNCYYKGGNSK